MAELYNIGISTLLATQRVLGTIGHNIANANTDGYTRQRVSLEARPPQLHGGMYFGNGVSIRSVDRVADQYLVGQIRTNATGEKHFAAYFEMSSQVTNLLADSGAGLAPAVQDFYDALQDLNGDPASTTARMVLLNNADMLTSRFHTQFSRLQSLNDETNRRLTTGVDKINSLAGSIAQLNDSIVRTRAQAAGDEPNDLLDQRDRLLTELAEMVNVTTIEQDDGQYNVTIGHGQLLVAGDTALALTTVPNQLDATQLEIAYTTGGATVSSAISGGEIGGIMKFRDEVLGPAMNGLGRVAATLAQSFNALHRGGMDLNGDLGGDFFSLNTPQVLAAPANSGGITVAYDDANIGALTTADYRLEYAGSAFTLTNLSSGARTTLSGVGPYTVDGITITRSGAPAAGDTYLIRPTRMAARGIDLAIDEPRQIALATPVATAASFQNLGNATISGAEVLDPGNASLLTSTTLVFNDPPTTYQINGVGPLLPYTSDAAIDANGWRARISGTPIAGDRFTVSANISGIGDNANGLRLSALQNERILENGTASLQEAYSALVGSTGAQTQRAEISRDAMTALRDSAVAQREETSGVNLDEEAANLLEYQQLYQAAARVIQIGNDNITALLNILR